MQSNSETGREEGERNNRTNDIIMSATDTSTN